ncbi:MAG: UDP-4-amino-4,6-dideoxy-N-acetyl-beta-L-altrosamine transaminase [Candidatus Endolissoclinum sp. TMED37]|nr:MAG: UDP-4-amino-4,6-dideoxy-N-acetyl-beta-L-altrosamine transaminase [Candidatus Endolissoclinum sp. TMED37]
MKIPYGKQEIDNEDIENVISVLKSRFITQGETVPSFEKAVADFCGSDYALAANSATSSLHLACRGMNLSMGDIVWTSPISFVASANCAIYCGAKVDFVDINPFTYNLDPKKLKEKLIKAKEKKCLPKILIVVHLCGQPCELKSIWELSHEFGFQIIEDASHSLGAKYHSNSIGGCRYSKVTIFSFHPVKMITTGEGGIALTNDEAIYEKMKLLRSHGITRDPNLMSSKKDGPWYYQQLDLGYNYRMTDIQAALGISQLKKLNTFIDKRTNIAKRYDNNLISSKIQLPSLIENVKSSWHIYVIRIKEINLKKKKQIFEYLIDKGIGVNLHYIPIHLHPFYKKMGFLKGQFPEAEKYYEEAITLPIYPSLNHEDQDMIINTLLNFNL